MDGLVAFRWTRSGGRSRVVETRVDLVPQWRGGELERLRDEGHARLEGANARILEVDGWSTSIEVTFSEYGERGSIDVLATRRDIGAALVCEDKTRFLSAEETSRRLDVKTRLAPEIVFKRDGWRPTSVSRLLVLEATMTNRRRVAAHADLLDRVFPLRSDAARAWLRRPFGSVAALLFVSSIHGRNGRGSGPPDSSRVSHRRSG